MDRYRNGATGVVVQAVQLTEDNIDEVVSWCPSVVVVEEIDPFTRERSRALNLRTPAGVTRVSQGQYIVKRGMDFHRAFPSKFRTSYTPMEVPKGFVPKDVRESKILRDRTDDEWTRH